MYMHYRQLEPTSFMHAIYIAGHENISSTFNGETYEQFPYDMLGMTITNAAEEFNIQVFSDDHCSFHYPKMLL